MALAAASEALGLPAQAVSVNQLEVEQMLPLDGQTQLTTRLIRAPTNRSMAFVSRSIRAEPTAPGVDMRSHGFEAAEGDGPVPLIRSPSESGTVVSPAETSTLALRRTGSHHGQAFAALTRIVRKPGGFSEAEIVLPDEAAPHRSYRIHPVMLDAALQCLAAALPAESLSRLQRSHVSAGRVGVDPGVRRCRPACPLPRRAGQPTTTAAILGRVVLMNDTGTPTAEIDGIFLQRMQRRTVPLPLTQKIFETSWVQTPTEIQTALPDGSWLVLTDGADAERVRSRFHRPLSVRRHDG